jgi:dTDP-4-dehydrorhamnose reductase
MQKRDPILVAGQTGQLARSLIEEARARGVSLRAMEPPELDLVDPDSIKRAIVAVAPCAVINAAAYTAVDRAEADAERAFAINRDGAGRLAEAAAHLGVPFIHVSTDYVFDGTKDTPYNEDDLPAPINVYGQSKLAGEHLVHEVHPAALIVRTSWVYSRYGQNFVKTMLRLAESREEVAVVDDQHGAPTAAHELAHAILDLMERLTQDNKPGAARLYHLTAGGETTWCGFARAIFAGWARRGHRELVVRPITTAQYPSAVRRPRNSRLECSRIAREFGVRLSPWEVSLEICLDELSETRVEAGR